jgi:proteic killer suppression protein
MTSNIRPVAVAGVFYPGESVDLLFLYNTIGMRYGPCMPIKTFANKETAAVYKKLRVRKYSTDLQKMAYKKLKQLDVATDIEDMRHPPGNRLERLSGKLSGLYSVRINQQWRICFEGGKAMLLKLRFKTIINHARTVNHDD